MKPFNWTDKAAGTIGDAMLTLQDKFAGFMNKTFAVMPVNKLKIVVIVFGLLGGGCSLYLVANAVFTKPKSSIKIDRIDVPGNFDETGDKLNELIVDEQTYRQIQAFKKSSFYDSTIRARPGLQDSIKLLESIYHSQK